MYSIWTMTPARDPKQLFIKNIGTLEYWDIGTMGSWRHLGVSGRHLRHLEASGGIWHLEASANRFGSLRKEYVGHLQDILKASAWLRWGSGRFMDLHAFWGLDSLSCTDSMDSGIQIHGF